MPHPLIFVPTTLSPQQQRQKAEKFGYWEMEQGRTRLKHGLAVLVAIRSAAMVTEAWEQQLVQFELGGTV